MEQGRRRQRAPGGHWIGPSYFALRLTSLDAARETAGHPDGYYVADQELGATLARNFPSSRFALHGARHEVFTNGLGCFDWPVRLEPNEPYIIAIGDSFTWGHAPLEKKWTSIIERDTGIRVLKCGVPATGSEHQLRLLKRLVTELPHPPALVIQLHDATDFNDDFCFPSLTVLAGQRVPAFRRIRLSDGMREPFTKHEIERMRRLIERRRAYEPGGVTARQDERGLEGFLRETSTLYNMYDIVRIALERDRARRKIKSGATMAYLNDPIEFNLLLLNDKDYPFVASRFEAHIATLRATRDFVQGLGARYALFDTNSFRLPPKRPLVRRLRAFFDNLSRSWEPCQNSPDIYSTPTGRQKAMPALLRSCSTDYEPAACCPCPDRTGPLEGAKDLPPTVGKLSKLGSLRRHYRCWH
jgi:hypothetical protein